MKKKHLFFIHSNITLVLAFSIIEYLRLNNQDVIFFVKRIKIDPNWGINSINIEEHSKIKYVDNKIARLYKILGFDKEIKRIIKPYNDFVLYLAHFDDPFSQIIGSNNHCKQINFIEEGFMAFRNKNFLCKTRIDSKLKLLLFKLGWFFRVSNLCYFPSNGKHYYYAISKDGFEKFENKILIPIYQPEFIDTIKLKEHSIIIIIDAIVEHNVVSIDYYKEKMKLLINWLNKNHFSEVYLKWHPAQSDNIKSLTINLLNNNHIIINQLKNNEVLEYVFKNGKELKIVGFISSLLIYGIINNQHVFSLISKDIQKDELGVKVGDFPEIWNQIKLIA